MHEHQQWVLYLFFQVEKVRCVGKAPASPLSVRRAGPETQLPRWDTHKNCVLKLNTQKFVWSQFILWSWHTDGNTHSQGSPTWIQCRHIQRSPSARLTLHSEEGKAAFPKARVLWSILDTYFRQEMGWAPDTAVKGQDQLLATESQERWIPLEKPS